MTKVLVTGGCGFIGSNLVEFLLEKTDWHINILDNLSASKLEDIEKLQGFSERATFFNGDIRNKEDVLKAIADQRQTQKIASEAHAAATATASALTEARLRHATQNSAMMESFTGLSRRVTRLETAQDIRRASERHYEAIDNSDAAVATLSPQRVKYFSDPPTASTTSLIPYTSLHRSNAAASATKK